MLNNREAYRMHYAHGFMLMVMQNGSAHVYRDDPWVSLLFDCEAEAMNFLMATIRLEGGPRSRYDGSGATWERAHPSKSTACVWIEAGRSSGTPLCVCGGSPI